MRLTFTRQRHLVVAREPTAPRDWVFTCCAAGVAKLLGRPLRPGETVEVELTATLLPDQGKERTP